MDIQKELIEAKNMQQRMETTIQTLTVLQNEATEVQQEINAVIVQMNLDERTVTETVQNAVDDAGKKIYTNEQQRKIAQDKLLERNKHYQALLGTKRDYEKKHNELKLKLDLISKQRGTLKSQMELQGHIIDAISRLPTGA